MLKYILITLISFFSLVAQAEEKISIVNTGSASGGFAMQSTALAKDLTDFFGYDINFENPGDACVAAGIIQKTNSPLIMPWSTDLEAVGRDGLGCATFDLDSATVLQYNILPYRVCTMTHDDFSTGSTIGHSSPKFVFERAAEALNTAVGSNLKAIGYDGSGNTRKALLSGEVDFVILSPKHSKKVMAEGAKCIWEFSDGTTPGLIHLQAEYPDVDRLSLSTEEVFIALNMTGDQLNMLKNQVQVIHTTQGSAVNTLTAGGSAFEIRLNLSEDEIVEKWESSIKGLRE